MKDDTLLVTLSPFLAASKEITHSFYLLSNLGSYSWGLPIFVDMG